MVIIDVGIGPILQWHSKGLAHYGDPVPDIGACHGTGVSIFLWLSRSGRGLRRTFIPYLPASPKYQSAQQDLRLDENPKD